jgi:hypothetical protein
MDDLHLFFTTLIFERYILCYSRQPWLGLILVGGVTRFNHC